MTDSCKIRIDTGAGMIDTTFAKLPSINDDFKNLKSDMVCTIEATGEKLSLGELLDMSNPVETATDERSINTKLLKRYNVLKGLVARTLMIAVLLVLELAFGFRELPLTEYDTEMMSALVLFLLITVVAVFGLASQKKWGLLVSISHSLLLVLKSGPFFIYTVLCVWNFTSCIKVWSLFFGRKQGIPCEPDA